MCGIVGSFGPPGLEAEWMRNACDALRHRGPDSNGIWGDPAAGIVLGHTRLAIMDLSEAGQQPMVSASGRYHCVFNGEIYNHLELRRALGGHAWRGHSDTETVLECLANWGVEKTLQAMVGMFAIAVFDTAERRLILARDRLGEKPLYYGYAGKAFVFASELAPLRTAPGFDRRIDRKALAAYMQDSYVPAPHSIYASMRKLSAASWIVVTPDLIASRELPQPRAYWSAVNAAIAGQSEPLKIDDTEAVTMLERLLRDAVKGQMLSDVSLGAFLSGGIDSSTVTALMQAQSTTPVRTFSIGFDASEYDESEQARRVAEHLGTEHTGLMVRAEDALALVPRVPAIYSEPFADSSQLPTFLVAQLARSHVTVALSGDGGDELFGGYKRYSTGSRAWSSLSRIPRPVRRGLAGGMRALGPATWDRLAAAVRPITPPRYRLRMAGDKLLKGANALECRNEDELHRRLLSQWWAAPVVIDEEPSSPDPESPGSAVFDFTHRMMLRDAMTYLPDDILVKVDRAAMAVSLETRVPFLDHRVFEFAWRLPMHMKVRDGVSKWIVRQLLHRHVPRELVERPKMGFAVPLDNWLRGALREWAEPLIDYSRLQREGYLNPDVVRRGWHEHLSGRRNWQQQLWNVLMFQAWLEHAA
jgi:asparagine synthase (glutamine-hydrolysing)